MPNLFGVDIAGIVADATSGQLVPGTLHQISYGSRSGSVTGGRTQTETDISFEGIIESYTEDEIDETTVLSNDRRVLIITNSMAQSVVPEPNWDVTIEGLRYRVIAVSRDPAEATYTLQVRGR